MFSSIDRRGRYAYGNQPAAAQWNLARFAETLLPFIDADSDRAVQLATGVIEEFSREFGDQWSSIMRRKLGLFSEEESDGALIQGLLDSMQRDRSDFTLTFRRLCAAADSEAEAVGLDAQWLGQWRARMARNRSRQRACGFHAPGESAYIPRNHRIEAAIVAAVEDDNFTPFEELTRYCHDPTRSRRRSRTLPSRRNPMSG